MTPRRLGTKTVDRDQATHYLEKARGFLADAELMLQVGEFSGNGIAVLCVHAAIAFSDAVSIKAAGRKSASGEHTDAVQVLQGALGALNAADKAALKALRAVLQRKDEVSYTRTRLDHDAAAHMLARLVTFARWAEARVDAL